MMTMCGDADEDTATVPSAAARARLTARSLPRLRCCPALAVIALLASSARANGGPFADEGPVRPPVPEQTSAESAAWLVGVGALGGAVGYGLGVISATFATNGSNPVNAALQHQGEWGLVLTSLLVPIPMAAFLAGAVTLAARDLVTGLAVAAATAGTALVLHGTLLVAGYSGLGPALWQVELPALVVAAALVATAGGVTAGLVPLVE